MYWRIGRDYRGLVLHPPNKIISDLRWRRGCFAESRGVRKKCPVKSEQRQVLEINMTKFLTKEDVSDIKGLSFENFFISF